MPHFIGPTLLSEVSCSCLSKTYHRVSPAYIWERPEREERQQPLNRKNLPLYRRRYNGLSVRGSVFFLTIVKSEFHFFSSNNVLLSSEEPRCYKAETSFWVKVVLVAVERFFLPDLCRKIMVI